MKVLVAGATENVGSAVVAELRKRGAQVRVLALKQSPAERMPAGVEVAIRGEDAAANSHVYHRQLKQLKESRSR